MSASSKTLLLPAPPIQRRGSIARGTQVPAGSPPFGQNTLQFFAEGERHESTGWQDTILPADDEPDTRVRSGSFDKIPRQKSALLTVALLGVGLIVGAALGVRALARTGWKVNAAAAALSRSHAPVPSAPPAPLVPTGIVLPPAPASPPTPSVAPAAAVDKPEVPRDGESIRAADDNEPNRAIKHAKALAQAEHHRTASPRKVQPRHTSHDDLEQEANPAVNGEVVQPLPLRNPSRIEPPQELSPPPEHPAPTVPEEAASSEP
jgi:hypothetical protein